MERNLHKVVSLDKGRVAVFSSEEGPTVIIKRTSSEEFNNLLQMRNHILSETNSSLTWNGIEFKVVTPTILKWDASSGELTTEYFSGQNLEILLLDIDKDSRSKYVGFVRSFVDWMKQKGIIWKDCAPRNILINEDEKIIFIADFEKGNKLQSVPYSQGDFNSNVRGIIYEEMCAFLFPEEQEQVFGSIWDEGDRIIPASSLRGKREPILYEMFFGEFGDQISLANLLFVQKFMASMITPYCIGDRAFFPLTLLAGAGSPEKYTSLLLGLYKINREEWPIFLANSIQE